MKLISKKLKDDFIDRKRYNTEELVNKRANSLSKYTTNGLFYIFTSFYGFIIMKDTDYMSPYIFGQNNGKCSNIGNHFDQE